jgi:integrase/recombinase XerC
MNESMNPADWIDGAMTPPRRLPADTDAALAYLADTFGHVVYTRWTLATIKGRYASLADAKVAHPAVMRQLLDRAVVIEYWDRGRVRTAAIDDAPTPQAVLQRVLHTHRRRFKVSPEAGLPCATGELIRETTALTTVPHSLIAWLARDRPPRTRPAAGLALRYPVSVQ